MGRKDGKGAAEFDGLRLIWLEAFVQVAETGKRTAAAAEMGINQGTVTKHIQNLERWLGGGHSRMLMVDNVWPVSLTAEGEAFLPVARQVLGVLREAKKLPEPVEMPSKPCVDPRNIRVPKLVLRSEKAKGDNS